MKGRTIGILAGLGAIVLGTALTTWLSGTVTTLTSQQPLVVSGTAAAPAVVASGAILLVSALALTTASRTVARVILAVAAATSALGVGMVVWVLAHTEDVMIASASGTSGASIGLESFSFDMLACLISEAMPSTSGLSPIYSPCESY